MSEAGEPGPVAVLGAGAWGTALAVVLGATGHEVRLWSRDPDHRARLRAEGENRRHLPGIALAPALALPDTLEAAAGGARDLLLAVPFAAIEALAAGLQPCLGAARVTLACKGIEPGSGRLAHTVVAGVLGAEAPLALLSGPTFAREVAAGRPSAAVAASTTPGCAAALVELLHGPSLRIYSSSDVTGVALAGALKNVLAIAAGISDGLGFGANARAALITRGLAEITRMGLALGAARETFAGLAGVGDVVLSCTDDQSRNRRLGLALAEGLSLAAAGERLGELTEGVPTARAAVALAARHGVEMPLAEQVARILGGEISAERAVGELLARAPRAEAGEA